MRMVELPEIAHRVTKGQPSALDHIIILKQLAALGLQPQEINRLLERGVTIHQIQAMLDAKLTASQIKAVGKTGRPTTGEVKRGAQKGANTLFIGIALFFAVAIFAWIVAAVVFALTGVKL